MGSKTTKTTTTPTNPQWVTDSLQGLSGQIGQLANANPQDYVAGSNKYLDTAGANLMGGGITPQISDLIAKGTAGGGGVGYHSGLDNLQKWMNPYTSSVVDSTLKSFDQNAGQTRAQQALSLAGSGAFGGSGAALTQSMTEGQLAQARAAAEAGLRSDAFNTAAGNSSADANRFTQADTTNAQMNDAAAARALQAAGMLGSLNSQNNTSLMNLGQTQYGIDQAHASAPLSLLALQSGLTSALPYNLFSGQNSTQKTSDPMGAIGSGLMGAAALFGAPFTGGTSLGLLGALGRG